MSTHQVHAKPKTRREFIAQGMIQGAALTMAPSAFCKSRASEEGLWTGGSPLRFALVDTSGPVRETSSRSQPRAGMRTASVEAPRLAGIGVASGRITVNGAGQIASSFLRRSIGASTPRSVS